MATQAGNAEAKLAAVQAKLAETERYHAELLAKSAKTTEDIREARQTWVTAIADLESAVKDKGRSEGQREAAKAAVEATAKQLQEQEARLVSVNAALAEATARLDTDREQAKQAGEQKAAAKAQLDAVNDELKKASAELAEARGSAAALNETIAQRRKELDDTEARIAEAKARLAALKAEFEQVALARAAANVNAIDPREGDARSGGAEPRTETDDQKAGDAGKPADAPASADTSDAQEK
jgi:chromosome segregation ATPase